MIKKVISDTTRVPIKIWTDDVEESAAEQLRNTANLPIIFKHLAVMPDVHYGIGSTIGSVIPTEHAIIPAAVGVDIGCGMLSFKVPGLLKSDVAKTLKEIRQGIQSVVPVGFKDNGRQTNTADSWHGWEAMEKIPYMDDRLREKAHKQLGSLGGGNHFIEVCEEIDEEAEDKAIRVMLHSGSRGVGNFLARVHIKVAQNLMEKFRISLPDKNLAYLPEGTPEFDDYMLSLRWLQSYAKQNRAEMGGRIVNILFDIHPKLSDFKSETYFIPWDHIDCHHNYTELEHHYGRNVWITRKGAVRAREGDMGIIPGSMGRKSYIVRGKGNPESFNSCSHGAGRRMSRKKAKETFTVKDLEHQTDGVECRKDEGVLDEIPGAYKDLDTVMENQSDLVEIVVGLKQLICVKG